MLRTMKDVGPPISNSDLDDVEAELGLRMPPAFRAFLLRNNGGVPEPSYYFITGLRNNPWNNVEWFNPLHSDGVGGGVLESTLDMRDRLPADCIDIASAPGGALVIGAVGPREGRVWFWDWYVSMLDDPETRIYPVADSFEAFLAGLADEADMPPIGGVNGG